MCLVKENNQLNLKGCERCRAQTFSEFSIAHFSIACGIWLFSHWSPWPYPPPSQGHAAMEPIVAAAKTMLESSTGLIQTARSLAVNPKDPPKWSILAGHSRTVSDSIKKLITNMRYMDGGQGLSWLLERLGWRGCRFGWVLYGNRDWEKETITVLDQSTSSGIDSVTLNKGNVLLEVIQIPYALEKIQSIKFKLTY